MVVKNTFKAKKKISTLRNILVLLIYISSWSWVGDFEFYRIGGIIMFTCFTFLMMDAYFDLPRLKFRKIPGIKLKRKDKISMILAVLWVAIVAALHIFGDEMTVILAGLSIPAVLILVIIHGWIKEKLVHKK